jgi:hypothetical protein
MEHNILLFWNVLKTRKLGSQSGPPRRSEIRGAAHPTPLIVLLLFARSPLFLLALPPLALLLLSKNNCFAQQPKTLRMLEIQATRTEYSEHNVCKLYTERKQNQWISVNNKAKMLFQVRDQTKLLNGLFFFEI